MPGAAGRRAPGPRPLRLDAPVLALAAHLDDDGTVPVVFFDTDAHPATEVSLDCHEGRVQELHQRYGHMGTTDYAAAMLEVIEHYTATGATAPEPS